MLTTCKNTNKGAKQVQALINIEKGKIIHKGKDTSK